MTSTLLNRQFFHRVLPAGCAAVLSLAGAGCVQKSPVYAWSHPAGGEYLFAFDTEECAADTGNGFFACMKSRGYFLVDPDSGRPLADAGEPMTLMAPGFTQAGR